MSDKEQHKEMMDELRAIHEAIEDGFKEIDHSLQLLGVTVGRTCNLVENIQASQVGGIRQGD